MSLKHLQSFICPDILVLTSLLNGIFCRLYTTRVVPTLSYFPSSSETRTQKLPVNVNSYLLFILYTGYTQKNGAVSKVNKNFFLTLHGHNVHRQQWQLSEFLIRYQQFASHAYCGAAGPVSKMESQQEKAFCVLRFEVSRSVITVQREFCARFRKDAPFRNIITRWCRQFVYCENLKSGG